MKELETQSEKRNLKDLPKRPKSDGLEFALLDYCDAGLIIINEQRVVSFWNSWMERTSGFQRKEVLGRTLEDIFPDLLGSRTLTSVENAFRSNLPSVLSAKLNRHPFPLLRRTNELDLPETIDQQISIKKVTDSVEETFCFIQITDVSAATKRELMLRKVSRENRQHRDELSRLNSQKDRLFSIIAHDLKSPFTAILGFSDLLETQSAKLKPSDIAGYIRAINISAHQMYKLLENLLDWSLTQMGRLKFEPLPLEPRVIINECVQLLSITADSKDVMFKVELDESILVNADARMTSIILRNLVNNAVKFSNSGGTVTITARGKGDFCEFEIMDDGVGMTTQQVDSLFDFDSGESTIGTNGEIGTGLGLHLCKDLICKQGGSFWVKSEPDLGSKFYFTLPAF